MLEPDGSFVRRQSFRSRSISVSNACFSFSPGGNWSASIPNIRSISIETDETTSSLSSFDIAITFSLPHTPSPVCSKSHTEENAANYRKFSLVNIFCVEESEIGQPLVHDLTDHEIAILGRVKSRSDTVNVAVGDNPRVCEQDTRVASATVHLNVPQRAPSQ
jgi:hypothetical protein